MEQKKQDLIEFITFIIITFCISYFLTPTDIQNNSIDHHIARYLGRMVVIVIIPIMISKQHYRTNKRLFFRILMNSLWISSAISFFLLSRQLTR